METSGLKSPNYSNLELGVLYALWVAFFFYIASIGWVSEDAYITFRVIEHFFEGHGLRWNTYERVQAYTHPLWMLLQMPVYAFVKNLFLAVALLSTVCAAFAVLVVMCTGRRSLLFTLVFLFLPLFASKSFIDYTSSGLENPLSYLLFAVFTYVIYRLREHTYFWFFCSLTVALSLFNRLDTILLYAPVCLYLFTQKKPIRWGQVILGMMPLIAWFAFSLFYYGFLFPNTKYAKLGTDMSLWQYLSQGFHYLKYLLIWDTTGALVLTSCFLFLLPRKLLGWLKLPEKLPSLPVFLALGILFYSTYVIYIGGDYMAGRFWALPVFAGICLWFYHIPDRIRPDIIFTVICALCITYFTPKIMHEIRQHCKSCIALRGRVIDARFVFMANKVLLDAYPVRLRTKPQYPFVEGGEKLKSEKLEVKKLFYIGMTAYYAGNKIKFIDELGLADPLLARLPASDKENFYIGHFRRDLPKGYHHAVKTGELDRMHPSLARYYDKLRLIVSGELLDKERLKTILLFNIGYYDHWKNDYLSSLTTNKEAAPAKSK